MKLLPAAVHESGSDVTAELRIVCCWGKSGCRDCVTRLPSLTQSRPTPSADAGPVSDAPYATP